MANPSASNSRATPNASHEIVYPLHRSIDASNATSSGKTSGHTVSRNPLLSIPRSVMQIFQNVQLFKKEYTLKSRINALNQEVGKLEVLQKKMQKAVGTFTQNIRNFHYEKTPAVSENASQEEPVSFASQEEPVSFESNEEMIAHAKQKKVSTAHVFSSAQVVQKHQREIDRHLGKIQAKFGLSHPPNHSKPVKGKKPSPLPADEQMQIHLQNEIDSAEKELLSIQYQRSPEKAVNSFISMIEDFVFPLATGQKDALMATLKNKEIFRAFVDLSLQYKAESKNLKERLKTPGKLIYDLPRLMEILTKIGQSKRKAEINEDTAKIASDVLFCIGLRGGAITNTQLVTDTGLLALMGKKSESMEKVSGDSHIQRYFDSNKPNLEGGTNRSNLNEVGKTLADSGYTLLSQYPGVWGKTSWTQSKDTYIWRGGFAFPVKNSRGQIETQERELVLDCSSLGEMDFNQQVAFLSCLKGISPGYSNTHVRKVISADPGLWEKFDKKTLSNKERERIKEKFDNIRSICTKFNDEAEKMLVSSFVDLCEMRNE